ncbi:MAG TPA: hypothetical protein VGD10_00925 [Allosphingosinicella sp.]|uniref:hypothetical protein n=1 Tax=Allosphingosinicella sp. TaxID=2823234 RepID=UPI002EDA6CD0
MRLKVSSILAVLLATSCGDYPRDPEGTLKRVQGEKSFRVGLVAPLGEAGDGSEAARLLQAISVRTGAEPRIVRGDAEPLLNRLEEGDLDLVIGRFEKKSPWARLVTIGPPLRREMHKKVEFHLAPVMMNGENAWIGLVEREARNVAPEAQ